MKNSFVAAASIGVLLTACGGGGASGDGGTPALTDAQRAAAATITAQSSSNACGPIRPFYWEIGDRSAALATGSVNGASGTAVYTAATPMSIASASKWLYSSYVVQKQNAALSDSDIKFLTFRSGYTNFTSCLPGQTVDSCVNYLDNGVHSDATDGRFDYGGGHMQKHASVIGLGALDSASLAVELRSQLGSDVGLAYSQPQPAGGVVSTAADYARFLRKLLGADLKMATMLGSHAVCTNPLTCPAGQAVGTPVPSAESWHYSIGHWVEDDPVVGDGAFSSAGAFGFYPWIDASRSYYGVVARHDLSGSGAGFASVFCGRQIRKAWMTGVSQ
ncbi:MAG: beta-lactamase family protein [Betaproteobacteria bacterium]|nr:MAG: beta-lactamase family protein [Betaproteobacteria bacterium]